MPTRLLPPPSHHHRGLLSNASIPTSQLPIQPPYLHPTAPVSPPMPHMSTHALSCMAAIADEKLSMSCIHQSLQCHMLHQLRAAASHSVSTDVSCKSQAQEHQSSGCNMLYAGYHSIHGIDGSLIQMLLAGQEKMIEELQSVSVLLLEMRDDQRELLKLQKDRSQAAAAAAEEPATLDLAEVRAVPSLCAPLQPLMHGLRSGVIRAGCGVCSIRSCPA